MRLIAITLKRPTARDELLSCRLALVVVDKVTHIATEKLVKMEIRCSVRLTSPPC